MGNNDGITYYLSYFEEMLHSAIVHGSECFDVLMYKPHIADEANS